MSSPLIFWLGPPVISQTGSSHLLYAICLRLRHSSIDRRSIADRPTNSITYSLAVPADVYKPPCGTMQGPGCSPIHCPFPALPHHALDLRSPCARGYDPCGPGRAVLLVCMPWARCSRWTARHWLCAIRRAPLHVLCRGVHVLDRECAWR
jgi:hypothetical protein